MESQAGSHHFDLLYSAAYGAILRSAYLIVLDIGVAEEITQEAFLRLWQRRDRLAPDSNEKAWLMRVATNLAISHRRSLLTRWRFREEAPATADPAAVALVQIELRHMRRALLSLNSRERAVLALRFAEDLSFAQIGAIIGRPEPTIRTWLHRALAKLRRRLESSSRMQQTQSQRSPVDG